MAVEIPVVIDIDKAFAEAAAKVGKALKPLQDILSKDALKLRFKVDESSTRTVKKLLDGSTTSARELNTALHDVAARISTMQAKGGFIPGSLTANEKDLLNIYAQLQMRVKGTSDVVKVFGKNVQGSLTSVESAGKATSRAYSEANIAMERSNSHLLSLIKNSIRLIALHTASNFIRNVREVTSEFELQKVALGSIIQDTERANTLFKQIKAAAVESPFEIKDLVTYTKQLSAYQIETEKLFDTTMKLADISSGLGVDMGRLILAFGQVRAAAVLRGQELRQFTEAGIPLVEKLAQKFSNLNGRAVTTAEVFELISKRAVPFAMIEEIFNDMTSAGGAFYKMQEKQAETLLGQWNNLKDAVSIMYDEIGNTAAVHGAMQTFISDARYIMQNWREIGNIAKYAGIQFLVLKTATAFLPTLATSTKLLEKAELAEARAKQLSNTAHANGIMKLSAQSLNNYAKFTRRAAEATTLWGRSLNSIVAFFSGNWLSLALTALGLFAAKLIATKKEAERLNNELSKIQAEGAIKQDQNVRNFERLAKAAVEAADGSKQQADAIAELERTYGDILPSSDRLIDKLRQMEGNYKSLTDVIREKINMQIREQQIDEVTSEYSSQVGRKQDTLKKYLKRRGLSTEEISTVMSELQKATKQGLISIGEGIEAQAKDIEAIIYKYTGRVLTLTESRYRTVAGTANQQIYVGEKSTKLSRTFSDLIDLYSDMNVAIDEVNASMDESVGTLGKYADEWKELQDSLGDIVGEGATKFAKNESRIRQKVEAYMSFLKDKFMEAGIDISDSVRFDSPDFSILGELAASIKNDSNRTALTGVLQKIQKEYEKLVPDDRITSAIKNRLMEISETTGVSMDRLRSYIKAAGEDTEEYMKELAESIQKYQTSVQQMTDFNVQAQGHPALVPYSEKEISEATEMAGALQLLYTWLSAIIKIKPKTTRESDRLKELKQNISDVTEAYKKYYELRKYKDVAESMSDIEILFPSLKKGLEPSFENMVDELQDLLGKYKGDLEATRLIEQALRNVKFDKLKKDIDDTMKKLSDEIKQSETARNFYQSVFDLTGDTDLAATMSFSVYGGIGKDFKERMQDQLNAALESLDASKVTDELREAFASRDFEKILKNLDLFPEAWQEKLKEMARDTQKFNAERASELLKALQNAKTYGEKRVELAKQTAKRMAEIEELNVPQPIKDQLQKQNTKKEAEEAAKLEYEAFKDTPMYIELFADLDTASVRMLTNMRENLIALRAQWKDLQPTELKELQSRIDELDEQLASRNPFKALIESIEEYRTLQSAMSRSEADTVAVVANTRLETERQILDELSKQYQEAVLKYGVESLEAKEAKEAMDIQAGMTDLAKDEADAAQEIASQYRRAAKHIMDAAEGLQKWAGYANSALDGAKNIVDAFASDDFSESFGIIAEGTVKTLEGAGESAMGLAKILTGTDIAGGIMDLVSGLSDLIVGIGGTAKKLNIQHLNKEIKEQARLIANLEESYDSLSKSLDRAFGNDRVYNFNKMMEIMAAEAEAYRKQAETERAKGKKADEDTALGYERSARELDEKMRDLRLEQDAFFAGADLASTAESFADAWLSAYQEFGDTSTAIEERMTEMVQTLMKKAALSGIAQNILGNWYASLADVKDWNAQTIAEKWKEAMALVNPMVEGMQVFANSMQAEGVSLRNTVGQFTGISRDIAGASEESINGLAAGINTQNFYMSFMPLIHENVAQILTYMTGGNTVTPATQTGIEGMPSVQKMVYDHLPNLDANINSLLQLVKSVISPKSAATATHYVSIK